MHGQLGGAADVLGLPAPRVLHAGQLDEDPVLALAGQRRLGDTEGVDAAAEHLDGPVDGSALALTSAGVLGLEDELGAAAEVQAEAWLLVQREGDTADEQAEDEQETDEGTA